MKKALAVIFCFFNSLYSGAQDKKSARLDITAGYSLGYQFFKLDKIEYTNSKGLQYVMPSGFYNYGSFKPTLLNSVDLFITPFKNKNWYIGLHGGWGNNQISSYGYTIDQYGNPMQYETTSTFSFWYWGYGVKRIINLNRWGNIMPGFSFSEISGHGSTQTAYIIKDKVTGEIIKSGRPFDGAGSSSYFSSIKIILRLFDSPKLSLDYHVKLINHVYLKASYSYWLAGAGIANFYGVFGKRSYQWRDDLYSHNLSVGLTLRLRK